MNKEYSRLLNPSLEHIGAYTVEGGQEADVKLNQNESPFDLPQRMKEAILDEFKREAWNRYPDILPFRGIKAYAEFVGVSPDSVMMSNGSNEMLYTIFLACLCKGRKILIPQPSFSLYEKIARLLQAEIVAVPMREDLSFDVAEIIRMARDEQVGFIVLSTPNNPTSKSVTIDEIRRIAEEVEAIVLVDEAYVEFSRQESAIGIVMDYPNLIVLRTMSKALALAGLRIGFTIANPGLMAQIVKPKIPFTSSRLAEITLKHVLGNYELVEESVDYILRERGRMMETLRTFNSLTLFESDANFIIIRVFNAKKVFSNLAGEGILVRNVSGYPMMENCLRFNVGLREENDLLLDTLRAYS